MEGSSQDGDRDHEDDEEPSEKSFVFFVVREFGGDPADVSSVVGLPPSRSWRKGDLYGASGTVHTHDRWELRSPAPESALPEEKLDTLVSALEAVAPGVRAAAERFKAGIGCVVYTQRANPGFHVSADCLRRVAALHLSLDFDVYLMSSE